MHFLPSHLEYFPEYLDICEEQGEWFHHDICEMEKRCQDKWNTNMIRNFYWSLKRDQTPTIHKQCHKMMVSSNSSLELVLSQVI